MSIAHPTTEPSVPAAPRVRAGELEVAARRACERIAPVWPLDRFIAVNPFWPRIDQPVSAVSAELGALSGSCLLMPRAFYRQEREAGRLGDEDLRAAIDLLGSWRTPRAMRTLLAEDAPTVRARRSVLDVVDDARDLDHEIRFRDFVTTSISQFCASYFDETRAGIQPIRDGGLYAAWCDHAMRDRAPELAMGEARYAKAAALLPATPTALLERAVADLELPTHELERYLEGRLLDLLGWASFCAYRRWTARQRAADDDTITDLLAIRVAWDWMLLEVAGPDLARRWRQERSSWRMSDAAAESSRADDWVFQTALEIGYQRRLASGLARGLRPSSGPARAQAVFCIDVRSEVLRRALEKQSPAVATLGFAGFFGVPLAHRPLGSATERPGLPGLLVPRFSVSDLGAMPGLAAKRVERLEQGLDWSRFRTGAFSAFSFVETMGLGYAAMLFRDTFGLGRVPSAADAGLTEPERATVKPRLVAHANGSALDVESRSDLAAGILRGMSLTRDFARTVLLVGHASSTRNNPHGASLDCGACCGHGGDVNARVAAALLNDADVRAGLARRGIEVPATTHFVAGLHDTTTERVALLDLDEVPSTHASEIAELGRWLDEAAVTARRERASRSGEEELSAEYLAEAADRRARDWAEVRPEWGLANNAAFIAAPRERTRPLDLEGRSFLHEYRFADDPRLETLELILTAPVVVAHWINFQYYASTVDNPRYGSGNKLLHDVVGDHLGVFEGNGGDLRIGLPMQSLHDGTRWMHTPLRLSVFVEAPTSAIDEIVGRHELLRRLVDNQWLYLFAIEPEGGAIHALHGGRWRAFDAGAE